MKIEILDKLENGTHKWFLGKTSLWDYLCAVTKESFEFDIQRGVVKNKYLDTILSSIYQKEPIPPLTLTTDSVEEDDKTLSFDDGTFGILDGLQRTYRLWAYKQIADLSPQNTDLFGKQTYDIPHIISQIKEKEILIPGVISIKQIRDILDVKNDVNVSNIRSIYESFNIYIYLWSGLDEEEIVKKMLILNAGQRKVSISHQYELMFLRIFSKETIPENIKLVREKDSSYGTVKNGSREIGQFIFSSVVIGLQSLIHGKPIRLSPEYLEDDYVSEDVTMSFFNQSFLKVYLNKIYQLDKILSDYNKEYIKWFVKDTTISGIMGAIGYHAQFDSSNSLEEFTAKFTHLHEILKKQDYFDLDSFYKEYGNLSSTKINIGDKVRDAIYEYTKAILSSSPTTWNAAFNSKKEV
jgi:hypothetical protein